MCSRQLQRVIPLAALALALLMMCIPCEALRSPVFRNPHSDIDMVPGWRGSDTVPPRPNHGPGCRNMIVLDEDARIFLCKGLITNDEADHIRELAERQLTRSNVVDTQSASGGVVSNIRTSFGTFLGRGQDDVIKEVEKRIAEWTLLPVGNGEGLQVLRYEDGQKYDAHWDYFFHKDGTANGGNRYATVLMYLADTEEGGETVFPNIPAPGGENEGFSECARRSLAARPVKGDAVLFHSIQPSGALERRSLHTACPVLKGTKWSAAKWVHVGHYAMGGEARTAIEQTINEVHEEFVPGVCKDLHDLCAGWAAAGECGRNPGFMVGSRAAPGKCLAACGRCDLVRTTGAEQAHGA